MTNEIDIDWTGFAVVGGTVHNMTDPQCRPRDRGAPVDRLAVCVACAKGNREHHAHDRMPCRHWEQTWTHNGFVNDHPSYWVSCPVCERNVTIVLGWERPRVGQ